MNFRTLALMSTIIMIMVNSGVGNEGTNQGIASSLTLKGLNSGSETNAMSTTEIADTTPSWMYSPVWDKIEWPLMEGSCKVGTFAYGAAKDVAKEGAKGLIKAGAKALAGEAAGKAFNLPDVCDVFNPEKMDKYYNFIQNEVLHPPRKVTDFDSQASLIHGVQSLNKLKQTAAQLGTETPEIVPPSSEMTSSAVSSGQYSEAPTGPNGNNPQTGYAQVGTMYVWNLDQLHWEGQQDPAHPGVPAVPLHFADGSLNQIGYDWINLPYSQTGISYTPGYADWARSYVASNGGFNGVAAGAGPL